MGPKPKILASHSIQLAISGGVIYPVSAEKGSLYGSFIVHYSDGTEAVYQTSGHLDSKEATDAPGYLTYIRLIIDGDYHRFMYTYTDEGVTTEEFELVQTMVGIG